MEFSHTSVLLAECIEYLNINPEGTYIDCTAGGGGHSYEIAKRLNTGRLICFDRDKEAIEAAKKKLSCFSEKKVYFINRNFAEIKQELEKLEIKNADGILMDLGVSSYQLDNPERGFSFHEDAPLDMRMSGEGLSAYDVVNEYSRENLERILYNYGEEKFARSIVQGIIKRREESPVRTTGELAEIIRTHVPSKVRNEKNPCRKTFQAIRIEVNDELGSLQTALYSCFDLLASNGRLAVITFHSLEDRMVKNAFREFCTGCTCPPDFPVCVCGKTPRGRLINKKPLTAGEKELSENKRSRSAKLRVIEKL